MGFVPSLLSNHHPAPIPMRILNPTVKPSSVMKAKTRHFFTRPAPKEINRNNYTQERGKCKLGLIPYFQADWSQPLWKRSVYADLY